MHSGLSGGRQILKGVPERSPQVGLCVSPEGRKGCQPEVRGRLLDFSETTMLEGCCLPLGGRSFLFLLGVGA